MSSSGIPARTSETVASSGEQLRLLLETLVDRAVFLLDMHGRIASWNAGAERIFGYARGQVVGRHVSELYTAEDMKADTPELDLAAARTLERVEQTGWRVRQDGSQFWACVTLSSLRAPSGELRGLGCVVEDLTQRGTDRDLRESEERFHHLVDAVTDYAIFMLDAGGHVLTWNSGAEKIKGYKAREIIGRHFSEFYLAEEREAGKPERILEIVRREGHYEDEMWRVRKDGKRFWANVVITALRDERGVVQGFAKVTRDLTSRREAEERLRQAEERFHLLVDSVIDYAIYMLDTSGFVVSWNVGAKKTKGYEASEIVGQHFSRFFTASDRAALKPERMLEEARSSGRCEDEGWRVRNDGSQFWANAVINALRDTRGEIVGFVKVTRDMTDRRIREEELRRSEERFRLLVEGVGDYAIYMLDPSGVVTTWNTGAERLKQYKASEIIGRHFELFFPDEDVKAGKPMRELTLAERDGRFEDEGWRVRKDGTRFWANAVVTALRDSSGVLIGFAKVTRDLTLRREIEETERRLSQEQAARSVAQQVAERAEEANRIKDEFLATVSHELRTPLHAIVGWVALLRDRPLEPTAAKAVEVIDRNAKAQVKLVDDILEVSRIINGKLRLELKSVDLAALAKEAIEVVRPAAAAKNISITFDELNHTRSVTGDPERLQQVAWNLLSNAVKFTERGGAVRLSLESKADQVELRVSDTGRGIEPDFLPFVFERFKQADASTTRHFGGLGLGLAIVRHIIELHGGSVSAVSEGTGRGATFCVSIPVDRVRAVAADETASGSDRPALGASSATPLGQLRVLVVDDDDDGRELIAMVLTRAGAQVCSASSVAEGFAAVKRFRPQILVSDIGMAGEDGYSFVKRVQALPAADGGGIPSLALTAYGRLEDRAKALAAGFTAHYGKPIAPDELITAVAQLAESSATLRS